MKTIERIFCLTLIVFFVYACNKTDNGPITQPPDPEGAVPPAQQPTAEQPEVNPADYLIEGTAFMVTNDQRIPIILHHVDGAKAAMIDDDEDGIAEIMVHSEDGFETVISLDPETRLPLKMCSSDGTVTLYSYKESNTLLDLAVMRPDQPIEYARDLLVTATILDPESVHNGKVSRSLCDQNPLGVTINGLGYSWELGGLCEIRDGNGGEFQITNIPVQACRNIFHERFGHSGIPVGQENKVCQQIDNQASVLSLISDYADCVTQSTLTDCIDLGLSNIETILENADDVFNNIGVDAIALAYGALISGYGDIKVTLTWDTTSDIDLWVTEPDGTFIYYDYPESPNGGILDYDDVDGYGPENIFWPENAPLGEYIVEVHYYQDNGEGSTNYTVQIEIDGVADVFEGTLESVDQIDEIAIFDIVGDDHSGKKPMIQKRSKTFKGTKKSIKN